VFHDSSDIVCGSTSLSVSSISAANTWLEAYKIATTPADAAYVWGWINIINMDAFPHATIVYIDDVSIRPNDTTATIDALPRAYLWKRDLSDYEYTLRQWEGIRFVETTSELVNFVVARYGSSSYTTTAENAPSQAAYRQRDTVVDAGSNATLAIAEAVRATTLATYKDPRIEVSGSVALKHGDLVNKRGRPVELALVRAGDRVRISGGAYAGTVMLIEQTEWNDGKLTITPERYASVAELLARSV
jgi:hypothetical protein